VRETKAGETGNGGRAAWVAFALSALAAGVGCGAVRERVVFLPDRGPPATAATFRIDYDEQGCPRLPEVEQGQRNCYPDPNTGSVPRDCVRAVRGARITIDGTPREGTKAKGPLRVHFDPFQESPAHTGPVQRFTVAPNAPYKRYLFYVSMADCPIQDPSVIVEH
jgi:hypothetical protein